MKQERGILFLVDSIEQLGNHNQGYYLNLVETKSIAKYIRDLQAEVATPDVRIAELEKKLSEQGPLSKREQISAMILAGMMSNMRFINAAVGESKRPEELAIQLADQLISKLRNC